jgi:hypothetical protein
MGKRLKLVFAAMAISAGAAAAGETQAPRGGGEACLQNNRLWGWSVVDNRTLSITDRAQRRYRVRVAEGCVGMRRSTVSAIEFRSFSLNLSCIGPGDFVRFVDPTLGRLTCGVQSVEPELPQRRTR